MNGVPWAWSGKKCRRLWHLLALSSHPFWGRSCGFAGIAPCLALVLSLAPRGLPVCLGYREIDPLALGEIYPFVEQVNVAVGVFADFGEASYRLCNGGCFPEGCAEYRVLNGGYYT